MIALCSHNSDEENIKKKKEIVRLQKELAELEKQGKDHAMQILGYTLESDRLFLNHSILFIYLSVL